MSARISKPSGRASGSSRTSRSAWSSTYYDATIWIYVPETDLDAYQSSIDRLAGLARAGQELQQKAQRKQQGLPV